MSSTVVKLKPSSAGRRFTARLHDPELHKAAPCKSLLAKKQKTGGRNNAGRISVRHHGGGHKQRYRVIDFKRDKNDVPARVERIEYDPGRSANLALLVYMDGERRYIIAPAGVKSGDEVVAGANVPVKPGNAMPLRTMPVGTMVHCVEMRPGKGAQLARAAGSYVQYLASESGYASLRLRSGEVRKVLLDCRATVGAVGNNQHSLEKWGKAGGARWRGIRPTVRGVAMNPVDHPHGGGEGKTSGGRHPVSPWGVLAKAYRTRNNKRTDYLIVRRRKK